MSDGPAKRWISAPFSFQFDVHGTAGNYPLQHAHDKSTTARVSITNVADTEAVVTIVTVSSASPGFNFLGGNGEITLQPGATKSFTLSAVDASHDFDVSVRIDSTQLVVPGGEVRLRQRVTQHQEEVFDEVVSVSQINWYTLPTIPPRPPVQEVVDTLDASAVRN